MREARRGRMEVRPSHGIPSPGAVLDAGRRPSADSETPPGFLSHDRAMGPRDAFVGVATTSSAIREKVSTTHAYAAWQRCRGLYCAPAADAYLGTSRRRAGGWAAAAGSPVTRSGNPSSSLGLPVLDGGVPPPWRRRLFLLLTIAERKCESRSLGRGRRMPAAPSGRVDPAAPSGRVDPAGRFAGRGDEQAGSSTPSRQGRPASSSLRTGATSRRRRVAVSGAGSAFAVPLRGYGRLGRHRPLPRPIPSHAGTRRCVLLRITPLRARRSRSARRPSWGRPCRRPRRACRPPRPPRRHSRTSGGTRARPAHGRRRPRRR